MVWQDKPGRDALGQACFLLHLVVFAVIVLGWTLPRRLLGVYLVFLPLVVAHWKLNRDACVLNNLENWLRYRHWRAPAQNREEGAWLRTLLHERTGIALGPGRVNLLIYGGMALCWAVALWRWRGA